MRQDKAGVVVLFVVLEVVCAVHRHDALPFVECKEHVIERGNFRVDLFRPVIIFKGSAAVVFTYTAAAEIEEGLAVSKVGKSVNAERHVGVNLKREILFAHHFAAV